MNYDQWHGPHGDPMIGKRVRPERYSLFAWSNDYVTMLRWVTGSMQYLRTQEPPHLSDSYIRFNYDRLNISGMSDELADIIMTDDWRGMRLASIGDL